jgi:hypothetical protein
VVSFVKFSNYIWSEYIAHAPVIVAPSLDVNLGVRPEQIAK